MPQKITDDKGEEQEVYSAEELEAARQKTIDEFQGKVDEEQTEKLTEMEGTLDKAKTDLAEAEKKLEGADDKDKNIEQMREAKESLETKVKEQQEQIEGFVDDNKKKALDAAINQLVDNDEESAKKVRYEYEKTLAGVDPKTPEEESQKLQKAFILAKEQAETPGTGSPTTSGGGTPFGVNAKKPTAGKLSEDAKVVGEKLGVSSEDIEKYDKQNFTTSKD